MTTPTEDIRRRLMAGEPITSAQTSADYGVSKSLLGTILRTFPPGVKIRRDAAKGGGKGGQGAPIVYRVTAPRPDPALRETWGPAPGVAKVGNGGRRARAVANGHAVAPAVRATVPKPKPNGSALAHPTPALGDSVTVFLLALTDDGRINLGLRDGESTWLTTVDGFSTR